MASSAVKIKSPPTPTEAEVTEAAHANEKVKAHTDGNEIVKTIYVPGKIVNIVAK